jgi:uncharacterized protein YndB with AHSA1/START domain
VPAKSLDKHAFYPHPPEAVWTALTDPRALAEWMFPNDFAPVVGREFRFQVDPTPGYSGLMECRVLRVEPLRALSWSTLDVPKDPAKPRPKPVIVTWTLAPAEGGTRLHLRVDGLENLSWLHRLMMRFGWGTMVKRWLPRVVGNVRLGSEGAVFLPGAIPLRKRCYRCRTIPAELVR